MDSQGVGIRYFRFLRFLHFTSLLYTGLMKVEVKATFDRGAALFF